MLVRRLESRAQFQALLGCPVLARSEHFVMHRMELPASVTAPGAADAASLFAPPGTWIGAMVPKRWARRAVTRNLIRRQAYALADSQLTQVAPAAFLIRLRTGYSPTLFPSAASQALRRAVRDELQGLFQRLAQRQEPRT